MAVKTFKGDVRRMFIKKISFENKNISAFDLDNAIVKKDAEFYENFIGNLINFDTDSKLFDEMEAISLVQSGYNNIFYVDYNTVKSTGYITKKELKEKKKEYKNMK